MNLQAGKVVHHENSLVEAQVRFWDDAKSPHDSADVTVFFKSDETNILILKTKALMKAQELITRIAGIALGRGDELLNDFIVYYQSIHGLPDDEP
jgi:hypothetical protein